MNRFRVWLFRGLVVVATGLMVVSFVLPWWVAHAPDYGDVTIYPYGLSYDLGIYDPYIKGAEMPGFFAPLIWAYLGICVVALLYGSWLGEKEARIGKFKFKVPKLLIGGVGLSYIVVAVLAVIIAAIRTGDFGVTLFGTSRVLDHPIIDAEAGLRFGYWLACGVGLLCIALALLREKIIGKSRINV